MNEDIHAATDPLFWSFHAFIDLLFDQWQRENRYPAVGCLKCAFRGMTGWTPERVVRTEDIGYVYDRETCLPPAPLKAKAAPMMELAPHAATFEVGHNKRSAAEGPLVFEVTPPSQYFRTAEIQLSGAELPSDFSYSGEVYLYPSATKLDLASSAFRERWRVGRFAVWALHHEDGHSHGGNAELFVDATTELSYIRKHQPASKWKVAVVVDDVRPVEKAADPKTLRARIVIDDVKIAVDRGSEEYK